VEVKVKLTQAINHFLAPIHERRARYAAKPQFIEDILISGNRRTLREASETMHLVWEATGLLLFTFHFLLITHKETKNDPI